MSRVNPENVKSAIHNFFLAMYRTQNISHAMGMVECCIDNEEELDAFEKELSAIKNRKAQAPTLNILVSDEPIAWKEVSGNEVLAVCGL